MKTLRTIACVLSSLIALAAFASCSSGGSSDDSSADTPTRVANYCGIDRSDESANPIVCDLYDDGTWVATVCQNNTSLLPIYCVAKGTYSGDPSKDGTVILTFTHYADSTHTLKEAKTADIEIFTIANGQVVYDGYTYYRQLLPNK